MTRVATGSRREAGQAAPIYITMVVGLLFLALAFLAVGQAGATRNGAQSGADAAALAATQESRDQFHGELLAHLLDPDFLRDVFNGNLIGEPIGCAAAGRLAAENETRVVSCDWLSDGRWGYTVEVESLNAVGDTILPGTENERAHAKATAMVKPLCTFKPSEDTATPAEPSPSPEPTPSEEPAPTGKLVCDGGDFELDPEKPELLPEMSDLFSVRLAED
ncbi:pilus assembly protein TadG-related protein [Streptomyces sp. NPDC020681]|uniref:pilus assembly protein TadG-related protein n=1 Tax=Streptomyces sp. NPDC020681 TaxID=3365083 RepID=UPI0037954F7D